MTDDLNFVQKARREKLDALAASGTPPFAYRFDRSHHAAEAVALYPEGAESEGEIVRLAGRLVSWRSAGKTAFAHLADSYRLRAEVHGPTEPAVHLCMAIPNCTYYESLVTSNPARREPRVGPDGLVRAPTEPGIELPDDVRELRAARPR